MKTLRKIGTVILGIGIILGLILLEMQYTKTNIDRCIKNGQDEKICQELAK